MAKLEEQVKESAAMLEQAWTRLQVIVPPTMQNGCRDHFVKRAKLHELLKCTAAIFPVRQEAWSVVQNVSTATDDKCRSPNNVVYGGNSYEMDFAVARHLCLISYVTTTWSISPSRVAIVAAAAGRAGTPSARGWRAQPPAARLSPPTAAPGSP